MHGWMDTDFSLLSFFRNVYKEEFHILKPAAVFFQVVGQHVPVQLAFKGEGRWQFNRSVKYYPPNTAAVKTTA